MAKSLKVCDQDSFPNIYILKIAATIPVTSCECERSGSVLKRLNTYLRASMGQERLTSLAMIHIKNMYDQKIDEEKVLEIFCKKQHRVMGLDFPRTLPQNEPVTPLVR